jgi:diguanylate cyclase (GGDEF)-like protein
MTAYQADKIVEELKYIISNGQVKAVFQPIISLTDGKVLGYEALSRVTCPSFILNTEELFRLASEYNCLWDLEQLCRRKTLEAAFLQPKATKEKKLFINVNPRVMHDTKFRNGFTKEYLLKYNMIPENIIFEITEREAIHDIESFQAVIEHYKKQHYKIAIDDAGAGYSGLNLISDIHPHYLKLDMKLIRNIDKDNLKYGLVKALLEFSRITNIGIIAEGIETKEELKTLVNLGVSYGQGYYIQKPEEVIQNIRTELVDYIRELKFWKSKNQSMQLTSQYIETISKITKVVPAVTKVEEVFDVFREDSGLYGMCIVEREKVLGIITRENLTLKLSGRYGFSLYQRKFITDIMDKEYLEVDFHTPISTVSYLAMERDSSKLYDMIVVTKEGKFYGTVTVKDLLQKITEIDVANAKSLNPLSGLPGNTMIEQELNQCISIKSEYSVLYIDIDNFKAYNDVYGIEKGDTVIKILSGIIQKHKTDNAFIGHVGGDDFIMILEHLKWRETAIGIIRDFNREAPYMYLEKDREEGFILTTNRHGEMEEFPLASITIAVVTNKDSTFYSRDDITKELARLKKKGKRVKGSVCYTQEDEYITE